MNSCPADPPKNKSERQKPLPLTVRAAVFGGGCGLP